MHLRRRCTYFIEDPIKGVMAFRKNAFLVRNACVDDKQTDKLINESKTKNEQNHQVQKVEKEMANLKSSVSEIKNFMTQKNAQTRQKLRLLSLF